MSMRGRWIAPPVGSFLNASSCTRMQSSIVSSCETSVIIDDQHIEVPTRLRRRLPRTSAAAKGQCRRKSPHRKLFRWAFGSCDTSTVMSTVVRNCTRDEGGPFEFGNQVLISSHRKLLRLNVVVVSVAETPGRRSRQARSREASASKPSMKCRKRSRRCQNRGVTLPLGSARGMS